MMKALQPSKIIMFIILATNSLLFSCKDDPAPQRPVANFEVSTETVNVGDSVIFTDLSTNNPTSWIWTFGDGAGSVKQHPFHIYESTGNFKVALNVSNQAGPSANFHEKNILAYELLPKAKFTEDKVSGLSPLTVQFTNSSEDAVSYRWDFGDNTTSTEENPTHTFEFNADDFKDSFEVTLTAYNNIGSTSKYSRPINITREILTSNPKVTTFDLWVDENIMEIYDNPMYSGMSIAFIDGAEVYTYHYGETQRLSNNMADDNTLYQIDFISNNFTGIATLRWLAQNDISLDAPIKSYLPDEVAPGLVLNNTEITFRHLLSHTSGLPRHTMPHNGSCNAYEVSDIDSIVMYNYLQNNVLLRTPGTQPPNGNIYLSEFRSIMGFGLLGLILERQNHKPLQQIYDELILSEIGITSTTLSNIVVSENIAYPYGGYGSGGCAEVFDHPGTGQLGAIGLSSNLTDMIEYTRFLLSYDVNTEIGKAISSSMESQYTSGDEMMCLSWFKKQTTSGDELFFNYGDISGMSAQFAINETKDKAVIFFTNYWISDPEWFFMRDFIYDYLDGNFVQGRKMQNATRTKRRQEY